MRSEKYRYLLWCFVIVLFSGCMNYYNRTLLLNEAFEQKNYTKAEELLDEKAWEKKKKNILIYYLNKGTVLHKLGKYKESNKYFQLADYYIEDYQKNYGLKALSFISNPSIIPYQGENFEKILLHYYATLNYLMLNDLDEALVECKRMLFITDNIADYYKKDSKLHQNALTHVLLGLVYDAQKDYNNAFIAYRNAYEIYKNDYTSLLSISSPLQLKKDLLRTAYLNGFHSDVTTYEKEFGIKLSTEDVKKKSVICFWNNGLCPVKEQNSITFLIANAGNGFVIFSNLELGLSFPFYVGNDKTNEMLALQFIRVSFPKYTSRQLTFFNSYIETSADQYPLELAEDVDAIAYRTLSDRMAKEIGEMLIRLATKKLAEMKAKEQNQLLGVAVNIVNTISEQADTRGWQMLPHSISYTRVPLDEDDKNLLVKVKDANSYVAYDTIPVNQKQKRTSFYSFTTTTY
jgi:hypothetical protein